MKSIAQMANEDKCGAKLAYEDGHKFVIEQLNNIKMELLVQHEARAAEQPANWGHAGDMEFVSARLGEIIEFLS